MKVNCLSAGASGYQLVCSKVPNKPRAGVIPMNQSQRPAERDRISIEEVIGVLVAYFAQELLIGFQRVFSRAFPRS